MSLWVIAAQSCIASGNSGAFVSVTTMTSSRISGDRATSQAVWCRRRVLRECGVTYGSGGGAVSGRSQGLIYSLLCGGLNLGRLPSVRNASVDSVWSNDWQLHIPIQVFDHVTSAASAQHPDRPTQEPFPRFHNSNFTVLITSSCYEGITYHISHNQTIVPSQSKQSFLHIFLDL